jgi:Zn-dependent protease/CBS domain-containing protein
MQRTFGAPGSETVFHSFSLGKLAGIDIRVHPSLALAAIWVSYEFGYAAGEGFPGVVFGLTLLTLILGCVVMHELGGLFMAREFGSGTREITLYPLGGAAFIERMPANPKREAAVTIAGPLVNVAIAACILPLVIVTGLIAGFNSVEDYLIAAAEPTLVGLVVSIFLFNIANVLFNLIPAFPMDGGRLVRAGLTTILGRETATNVAVLFGYTIASAMLIVGVWLEQPTLPLIALFVMYLAYVEGKGVRIETAMRRIRVGQFSLWDGGGIAPEVSLKLALAGGARDVTVVEEGRVVGMLWRRDVLNSLRTGAANHLVADVMDRQIIIAESNSSVHEVHLAMERANRWAIPVVEDGMYRGIFTSDRLMHVYKIVSDQTSGRRRLMTLWATIGARIRGEIGST